MNDSTTRKKAFKIGELAIGLSEGRLILQGTVTCGSDTNPPTVPRVEVTLKQQHKRNLTELKLELERFLEVSVTILERQEVQETEPEGGCRPAE